MEAIFSIIGWIFSNLITLAIIGAIFYFFFFRRKALAQKMSEVQNQPVGSTPGEGETDYSGNTGGIDWKLKSKAVYSTGGRRRAWVRTTRWETSSVKMPAGKYLMLMSTPGNNTPLGPVKQEGFFNTMINKAADFALDMYVTSYFGPQYQDMINVTGESSKVDHPALKDFLILTNDSPIAQRFLDDATAGVISNWKHQKMGFTREGNVDQFGLLFTQDGVILTCQADMANEQEAKLFADYGAVLAVKMKAGLS